MTSKSNEILVFQHFINGEWIPSSSDESYEVYNPANGELVAKVAKAGNKEVESAIQSAKAAFDSGIWSSKTPKERFEILINFYEKMIEHADELAYLERISAGTVIRRAKNLPFRNAEFVKKTAEQALGYSYKEMVESATGFSSNVVVREPIGVVVAITPWNVPMDLALWKIVPALAMGNTIIVKPASYTPLSTLKLAELAYESGIPKGVFNVITGPGAQIGETLVTHPLVDKVTFTGSTEVGKRIMELASLNIKRVTLELGGKSAGIVLPDADLDIAIPGIIFGFCLHSGQLCESGTRLIVHDSIYDDVIARLVDAASKVKVGDAADPTTGMGPVISKKQLDTILSYIQSGIDEGARLVYGGNHLIEGHYHRGYYVQPTIFADVNNDMKIAREEIFGPVLSVIRYSTMNEAIEIANDSIYGLAAGIWTQDLQNAEEIASQLKAGTVWVNDWHMTNYNAPFGGYKQSGFGRELGPHAFHDYTQLKHIHRSLQTDPSDRKVFNLLY